LEFVSTVFFFQAEDGIRDFHVTGVQTCALPICSSKPRIVTSSISADGNVISNNTPCGSVSSVSVCAVELANVCTGWSENSNDGRSEERRVGKEWRARWSPHQ